MDYQERSSELEQDADNMEERKEAFDEQVDDARKDWESKKGDQSVPGAMDEEAAGAGELSDEEPEASAESDEGREASAESDEEPEEESEDQEEPGGATEES